MKSSLPPLPIDSLIPQILAELGKSSNLALEAPPGAGKTTRVPSALLDSELAGEKEVWTLEPRRIAARMAARRVAEERDEKLGDTVGYQVRFEEVAGPRTRLRFLTEGVLTRRLLSDPQLKDVGIVVLDEFHERHLQADLALALLRRLQKTARPDLRLVVMSATLDAAPIAGYLDDCLVLRSEGKRFDVTIEHLKTPDERSLAEQAEAAVRRLVINDGTKGDILVFLPGAAEIRRAQAACAAFAETNDLLLAPLHGELPANEQDLAVRPASKRKIILSTNVAESSITIDGVTAVIDSGLARMAGHSPWSGLPTLQTGRISKASATQRAGRAGRTQPGTCIRLYTLRDFNARPDQETAEIHRADLAEIALELHAAGVADLSRFEWFESPPVQSLLAADELLRRLGAINPGGRLTDIGERMLRLPVHPRQSRMIVEAQSRGAGEAGGLIAALIGERDIAAREMFKDRREMKSATSKKLSTSDLLDRLDLFHEAAAAKFSASRMREMGLDVAATMAVDRVRRQLSKNVVRQPHEEKDVLISILAGYPDRVAKRRSLKSDNAELLLSGGGGATLSPASSVQQSEFLVAVDVDEKRDAGKRAGPVVRLASAIEPDWLIDLFAEDLRETVEARWNANAERVETTQRLLYDQLVIDETIVRNAADAETSRVLAEAAINEGLHRFVDPELIQRFLARIKFVATTFPERDFPRFGEENLRQALTNLCNGLRSFAELRQAAKHGLIEMLRARLSPDDARFMNKMAPEFVSIAGRKNVKINYEEGKPPWIASRLQDFFGMNDGPKIAGGRVSLVLNLLAPNNRPVQVTTDLAGFWQRTYPQVRKELSRRYPRHSWPEEPGKR